MPGPTLSEWYTIPGTRGCAKNGQPPKYMIMILHQLTHDFCERGSLGIGASLIFFLRFETSPQPLLLIESNFLPFVLQFLFGQSLLGHFTSLKTWHPTHPTNNAFGRLISYWNIWNLSFSCSIRSFEILDSSSSLQFHIMFSLYFRMNSL